MRRAALATVWMLLAALTAACDGPGPDTRKEHAVKDPAGMEAEFKETTKRLPLPPDAVWPPVVHLSPEPDGSGVMRDHVYEPGYGKQDAEWVWFCLWQREWLAQRGKDSVRGSAALDMMMRFKETDNYIVGHDDDSKQVIDELLAGAAVGDPSKVAHMVDVGCRKDL